MSLKKKLGILEIDPYLMPYEKDISLRVEQYFKKKKESERTPFIFYIFS